MNLSFKVVSLENFKYLCSGLILKLDNKTISIYYHSGGQITRIGGLSFYAKLTEKCAI